MAAKEKKTEKSKYQKFNMVEIARSEIKNAEYNPRTITKEAAKKLRKTLKEHGLVTPITHNKRTGNIVGGHQRIAALDSLHRNSEFIIEVAQIDVDEQEEVKLNLLLNQTDIQGEYDWDKVKDLSEAFDIDLEGDALFDPSTLDFAFAGDEDFLTGDEESAATQQAEIDKIKEMKKAGREARKGADDHFLHNDDYMLTLVFENNDEKHNFMAKIEAPKEEKFMKARDVIKRMKTR